MTDRQGFNGRIWPGEWPQYWVYPGVLVNHSMPAPPGVDNPNIKTVPTVIPGPEPPEPVEPSPSPYEWYTIKAGDSWWRIAHNHGMTVDELQLANLEAASRAIHPGQRLKIPI